MKVSRFGAKVQSVQESLKDMRTGPLTWLGLCGVAGLALVAPAVWRGEGWRSIAMHAGLFGVLAAALPDARRRGPSYATDLSVAVLACLLEMIIRPSSVTGMITGIAASAAGWSLGRSALSLPKLYATGVASSAAEVEAVAVNWFTALQRTSPERFDWAGLELWMREHPSHRDAYERVEAIWYDDLLAEAENTPAPLRLTLLGFSRLTAVTKLGLWLAPAYSARIFVFIAAVCVSAMAVYV